MCVLQGLVVPVLRNVETMNYADIEKATAELGEKVLLHWLGWGGVVLGWGIGCCCANIPSLPNSVWSTEQLHFPLWIPST